MLFIIIFSTNLNLETLQIVEFLNFNNFRFLLVTCTLQPVTLCT